MTSEVVSVDVRGSLVPGPYPVGRLKHYLKHPSIDCHAVWATVSLGYEYSIYMSTESHCFAVYYGTPAVAAVAATSPAGIVRVRGDSCQRNQRGGREGRPAAGSLQRLVQLCPHRRDGADGLPATRPAVRPVVNRCNSRCAASLLASVPGTDVPQSTGRVQR